MPLTRNLKPGTSPVWEALAEHARTTQNLRIVDLFEAEPDRLTRMRVEAAGLLLDYSRQHVTAETLALLVRAAEACGMACAIASLMDGATVNPTERRQALHTALRDPAPDAPYRREIDAMLDQMRDISTRIRSGDWRGATGEAITDVVNIGIGGSHLGPMLVSDALADYASPDLRCHYVSNIDRQDLDGVLDICRPATTVFIIASKTFTTLETLQNARSARRWLEQADITGTALTAHLIAVTASPDKARAFGISAENILPMWDWVGGRYSLWSAIGLSSAIGIGMDHFDALRAGAAAMDAHFRNAPLAANLPVILGLLGIWQVNFQDARSQAVLPYLHRLRLLPEFLQQLEMESNGKSTRLDGAPVDWSTAPVLWGTVETNGQHSFHQLLHQGTTVIPVDFILSLTPPAGDTEHHPHLIANCLAQARALLVGRGQEEALSSLLSQGIEPDEAARIAPHLVMPGNRPSNLLIMDRLSPQTLGALLALYEHKVFVQSVIWDINAFDQYGVELGKLIGGQIHARLGGVHRERDFDPATEAAIDLYLNRQK